MAESKSQTETIGSIGKETFLAWEKLRLLYLAILTVISSAALFFGKPISQHQIEFWIILAFGVVVANLCYFLAPIVETYISWLGFPSRKLRIALFIAGTLFASGLAVLTILTVDP